MIIFLHGPDTYRSREKLNAIIKRYRSIHQSGLSLTRFDPENFDWGEFSRAVKTVSMFNEKKLIVLEELLVETDQRRLGPLKSKRDIILVLWEKEVDKRANLFKWLKTNAQCQEFNNLSLNQLHSWIEEKCKTKDIRITKEAKELLALYVGSDLWRMARELEKLASFKKNQEIETEDVKRLVNSRINLNIFETVDAIAKNDKKKAIKLMMDHLVEGEDPAYLFSMILWQFRNLIKVKSGSTEGLHPFVAKKSTFLAKRFRERKLKKIYEYFLDLDLAIKTGRIEPRVALDLLIMEI